MPTPHDVVCHECDSSLVVTQRSMDSDGDVLVVVEPCPDCMAEAKLSGRQEAEDE